MNQLVTQVDTASPQPVYLASNDYCAGPPDRPVHRQADAGSDPAQDRKNQGIQAMRITSRRR